ncbi:MAG: NUDIX domain-containing protein [Patescibacteria group bacterium]
MADSIWNTAGGVVINPQGQVVVVSQKGETWSLPKGRIEEGEDALQAAQREIHEESGITELELVRELGTFERYKISPGTDGLRVLKRITIFLFKTKQVELKPIDPDNPEARWVSKEGVAQLLTYPEDKKFFLGVKDLI